MYEVRITPEGLRHLDRLPDKIRAAAIEAIHSTIATNPQRAGMALLGELEGLRSRGTNTDLAGLIELRL